MRSALVYQAAHYRAVVISGDGAVAVVHDDGKTFEATRHYLPCESGPGGTCESLSVKSRMGHLHTAVYEKTQYRSRC